MRSNAIRRNNKNAKGLGIKPQSLYPTCADHDKGLLKLEKVLGVCCDSRGNGSPQYGCWTCPHRIACEKLWGRASTQSSVRKLLPEEVKRFKKQFAFIKVKSGNEVVQIACCPKCQMAGLRLYDENGDKCPAMWHQHQWCRRCREWVIPEWGTICRHRSKKA